jgi:uncharacterized protein (DUF302 family)
MKVTNYAFKTTTSLSYDEAVRKATEELEHEGFGVLTEIDVQDTLKKKLDVKFRRYTILGACNPQNAYRALLADLDIGLMSPCNVIVYEAEGGEIVIAAIDPVTSMSAVQNRRLEATAHAIRSKLQRVIKAIESHT